MRAGGLRVCEICLITEGTVQNVGNKRLRMHKVNPKRKTLPGTKFKTNLKAKRVKTRHIICVKP